MMIKGFFPNTKHIIINECRRWPREYNPDVVYAKSNQSQTEYHRNTGCVIRCVGVCVWVLNICEQLYNDNVSIRSIRMDFPQKIQWIVSVNLTVSHVYFSRHIHIVVDKLETNAFDTVNKCKRNRKWEKWKIFRQNTNDKNPCSNNNPHSLHIRCEFHNYLLNTIHMNGNSVCNADSKPVGNTLNESTIANALSFIGSFNCDCRYAVLNWWTQMAIICHVIVLWWCNYRFTNSNWQIV